MVPSDMPSADHAQLQTAAPSVARATARVSIVLRPRSAPLLVELALRFVVDLAPRLQLALASFVLLPGFVVSAAAHHVLDLDWLWVWALALAYATACRGVFICACHQILLRRRPNLFSVITTWRQRALVDGLGSLIFTPLKLLMTITLIGGLVARRLQLIRPVMLLEARHSGALLGALRRGARRSWSLTERSGSPVGRVALLNLALTLGSIALSEIVGRSIIEQLWLPSPRPWLTDLPSGGVFALLGFFLSIPFTTAASYLAYVDGLTRRQEWAQITGSEAK